MQGRVPLAATPQARDRHGGRRTGGDTPHGSRPQRGLLEAPANARAQGTRLPAARQPGTTPVRRARAGHHAAPGRWPHRTPGPRPPDVSTGEQTQARRGSETCSHQPAHGHRARTPQRTSTAIHTGTRSDTPTTQRTAWTPQPQPSTTVRGRHAASRATTHPALSPQRTLEPRRREHHGPGRADST